MAISSGGKTTEVLYGLGPVAEKTDEWNYVLSDGINVPRQLTDDNGLTTLSVRYNPWGKPIETSGTGNFDASFIGTLIDATTGLIYVGNGQYYDPETGRFLTRGVNPNSTNPYVPWNPIGGIVAPFGLGFLYFSRKKNEHTLKNRFVLIAFLVLVLANLACCGNGTTNTTTATPESSPTGTYTPSPTTTNPPPTNPPATPTSTPSPTPECPGCTSSQELEMYGVEVSGMDHATVLKAVSKVGSRFSEKLGGGISRPDAFRQVYGEPFYFINKHSAGSECEAGQRTVVCYGTVLANAVDPARLLVHELGHALQHSRYNGEPQSPYGSLENARIVDDLGRWVTGKHSTDPNDPLYDPDKAGKFERTALGYLSEYEPDMYHGEPWDDWNVNDNYRARNEDFADMFMNWVYNSFDYSDQAFGAGRERFNWMDDHMYDWITG